MCVWAYVGYTGDGEVGGEVRDEQRANVCVRREAGLGGICDGSVAS